MPDAPSERLNLSLTPGTLKALDDWRRQQADLPTRADAARRILEGALGMKAAKAKPRT